MGSLMAGWDSPVPDLKSAKYLRNRSFTKEEIEAYWRSKKTTEEEHLRSTLSSLQETTHQESGQKESGVRLERSNSLPLTDMRKGDLTSMVSETDPDDEKIIKNNAWWTRSNFAFLNEPPVIVTEGPSYKYASQYHLTNFSSSEPAGTRPGLITT
ncbi:uncharacterized protein LOC122074459 [Macadamia integrifolia]|uniref:uncharacterized protein LOC122074459 n=1 Tax=Macadamia integrifolia TaxID=60698 RepID=UPI001C4F75D5|nr:uncharacterized protein LOC122074459 [Macadamia integrifolia]